MLSWVMDHPMGIRPLMVSKANTLRRSCWRRRCWQTRASAWVSTAGAALMWITGVLTLASLAAYL